MAKECSVIQSSMSLLACSHKPRATSFHLLWLQLPELSASTFSFEKQRSTRLALGGLILTVSQAEFAVFVPAKSTNCG